MKSRKNFIPILLLFILFALLQADFLYYLRFQGVKPDLLVLMCAFLGYFAGMKEGIGLGVAAGLIAGAFSDSPAGFLAAAYGLCGACGGLFRERRFNHPAIAGFSVGLSACAVYVLCCTMFHLLAGNFHMLRVILVQLIPFILYNALFIPPLIWLVKKFTQDRSAMFSRNFYSG